MLANTHKFRHARRLPLAILAIGMLSACAVTPPLYDWAEYEAVIYTGYKDPGSSDPVSDANILEENMQRTLAEGKLVPPGVRIHLGYLYFAQGRDDEAVAMFEAERENFPQSDVFVERLIAGVTTR